MTAFTKPPRRRSFINAANGLVVFFRTQYNAWIHLASAIIAIAAGLWLHITVGEWLALGISIALVFITEILNTAIEFMGDAVSTEYNENIRRAKDVSAGAVLFAAIAAVVTGAIIFLPKLL